MTVCEKPTLEKRESSGGAEAHPLSHTQMSTDLRTEWQAELPVGF